ncbi:MAG: response regulator [Lachnospiraceae bacterium]|nr:response regulator [Lachnospiraceae bacterium]
MNTLLIVEDDKMIRQVIRTIIRRSDIAVSNIMECDDGRTALEILKKRKVDVMITDIIMPGMDGIRLVQEMQKLAHKPFVVIVSGCDDFVCAVQLLRMGIRDYIMKPIESERLVESLGRLDREINEDKRRARELRMIGCQQLKYMILNESIPEHEVQTVTSSFEEQLLGQEYVVCCLENIAGEDEDSESYLCLGEIENNRIYVVGWDNKDLLLKNELRDCHVGVSRVHCGVVQLRTAYREAKSARKEAFLCVRHEVEYSGEQPEDQGGPDEEKIRQIAQLLGTDKGVAALKMAEQYFAKIRREGYSCDMLYMSVNMLINEICRIYRNVLQEDEKELIGFRDIYRFAHSEELMEEVIGWMIGFREKISEEFDDYKNRSKVDMAIAYIRNNYDKDLNMAVVSNHVSMNYSLFSYAFKQYTGHNFVSYLKELRVDEAKRLLAETDMRVIEISRRVGYENEKHFMKTFKSQCGISPTEYRRNMQFGERVRSV